MIGFIAGITNTDNIRFCPKCGAEIREIRSSNSAICDECGYWFGVIEFGVIEIDDDEDEEGEVE